MVFCCTMFQSAGFFELQHKLSPPHDPYSLKEISGGLVNSLSFDYYASGLLTASIRCGTGSPSSDKVVTRAV
jgi:hypothetical protein